MPLRSLAAKTPLRALHGIDKYEIFEGLSNSKNMIFNVKKLLNVGVDLTLQQKGR